MKFEKLSRVTERSECGLYELRSAETSNRREYWNAWFTGDGEREKHLAAGFNRQQVVRACDEHEAKRAVVAE